MEPDRLKHNFLERLRLKESWLIFFILGIIMLNYPFLHIFNKSTSIFSVPILFIYIYGGWSFSILVIYLFTKSIHTEADNKDRNEDT
jgi:hypothetical protein